MIGSLLFQVMDSDAEGVPSEFFDYFKVVMRTPAPLLILRLEADKTPCCAFYVL